MTYRQRALRRIAATTLPLSIYAVLHGLYNNVTVTPTFVDHRQAKLTRVVNKWPDPASCFYCGLVGPCEHDELGGKDA